MTETTIRFSIFLAMLILMGTLEALFPARNRVQPRTLRWLTHAGLVLIDTLAIRVLFPVMAVGAALWAQTQGWGALNLLGLPMWAAGLIAILILDMMIYWQHLAFHRIPILWRLHKVHHADRDLDASSGLRFHPIEIIISMLYKMAVVVVLGAPVAAVIIFEILLNACAIFNHANIRIPQWAERPIRKVLVTPALHRIHHSVRESETNTNFGFSVIWWDKIFGSYTEAPTGELMLGLPNYQSAAPSGLIWSLITPFKRD